MSNFKPGDKVWCRIDPNHRALPAGGELAATIVSLSLVNSIIEVSEPYWQVDIDGGEWHAPESYLRHRRPPEREREATGEWELCPWRPVTVAKEPA